LATTTPQPATSSTDRLTQFVNRAVYRLAKHWLALLSIAWGLYAGLPLLAPILMNAGWTTPAKIIYTVYRPACHQRPERSFFFGGPQIVYSPEELVAAGLDLNPLAQEIGNERIGWKVAYCERDVAIYGTIFLTGLIFGAVRRWRKTWLLPFRYYIPFVVPMAIDGGLQLFGFYESTWITRLITGTIFGVGTVLFAYPYLDEGMRDVRHNLEQKHL
jgi:uncharacterized membrane protein